VTAHDEYPYRHPWLGVEVRHLATLIAVARTRSFRQAAAELGYAQSAVGQQVAGLESVVGTRLVERRRGHKTVTLTPAGKLLVEGSVGIVAQLRAAQADIAAAGEPGGAIVRLAVASDATALLSRLLPLVLHELPGVRLRVTEAVDDADLVERLERGTADLGIGSPPADAGLRTATLLEDSFVVLAAPGSRLAGLANVSSPDQLAGERLIVPSSALSDAHIRAAGLRLERAVEVPLAGAVAPLVAAGVGVGLVPRSDAEQVAGLVALSTAGLIAPRRIVLCWHAARRWTTPLCGRSLAPVA
jgi:DNA-binding transcriptional LysR family regulator